MLTDIIKRIAPDGRAVMENTATGNTYVARLGFVPGNGNNIVALPDRSAADIDVVGVDEQAEVSAAAERDQEELREKRTREARGEQPRGLAPDEVPPHERQDVGQPSQPSTEEASRALAESDRAAGAKPKAKAKTKA